MSAYSLQALCDSFGGAHLSSILISRILLRFSDLVCQSGEPILATRYSRISRRRQHYSNHAPRNIDTDQTMLSISRIAFVRLAYLPERVNTLHRANSFAWYPFYHIKQESSCRSKYLSAFTRHFASATNHLRKPQVTSILPSRCAALSSLYCP